MSEPIHIVPLSEAHVARLAEIHLVAFPGFFLSSLGAGFLRTFYSGYIGDESAVSVVATGRDGVPIGAVVGTVQPAGFYSRLLRKKWLKFALSAARATLLRPRTIPRILRAVTYRGDSPAPDDAMALLASICVDPAYQGTGLGQRLLREWETTAKVKGSVSAYLTTDAVGNDGVNKFYRRAGWSVSQTYTTTEGRRMNRYEKGLLR